MYRSQFNLLLSETLCVCVCVCVCARARTRMCTYPRSCWAPPAQVVLVVKNLPPNAGDVKDTQVQSLGREDPLEREMV